ncbi:MAG: hypothetical protein ACU0DM_15140, partial [Paracoccus sp. (in: a-proteobacteria)]
MTDATPALDLRERTDGEGRERLARIERTWASPTGFLGWFMPVNHTAIGRRFIVTSFVFFLLSGVLALAMRLQLLVPLNDLLTPDQYNQ